MSEHEHGDETVAPETPHGIHIEAAEPDRASYPWVMTVILGFLALHLVGLTVLWLYFQRQSEGTVHTQILTMPNEALVELRAREQQELASYGVTNRELGLYRVPIDRGIELYLETVRTRTAAGEAIRVGGSAPGVVASPGKRDPAPAPAPAGGG